MAGLRTATYDPLGEFAETLYEHIRTLLGKFSSEIHHIQHRPGQEKSLLPDGWDYTKQCPFLHNIRFQAWNRSCMMNEPRHLPHPCMFKPRALHKPGADFRHSVYGHSVYAGLFYNTSPYKFSKIGDTNRSATESRLVILCRCRAVCRRRREPPSLPPKLTLQYYLGVHLGGRGVLGGGLFLSVPAVVVDRRASTTLFPHGTLQ